MGRTVRVTSLAALVLVWPGVGWSQVSAEDAIQARVRQYEAAYNAGDADAVAAIYAADASHTFATGLTLHGRAGIARGLKEMMAGPMKGTRISLTPLRIRPISPTVAVEEASFSMSGLKDASGALMPPVSGLCLGVYQKQDTEWFAAAVQCMVPPPEQR